MIQRVYKQAPTKKNVSLWNIADNKHRAVMEYLNSLQPRFSWTVGQESRFMQELEKIKSMGSTNDMLRAVGYRFGYEPKIYEKIDTMTDLR